MAQLLSANAVSVRSEVDRHQLGRRAHQEMLGHFSITLTADTYTSLLPEADLAIAEAAARLVPRTRAASEPIVAEPNSEPDDEEKSGPESVPDGADPLGEI